METLDKAIEAEENEENKRVLYCLRQQMICLIEVAGELPMSSPLLGGAGKKRPPETEAHSELLKACHEAGDLFYMMGLTLAGHLEGTPGEGSGVQDLAATAADRLMECLSAAMEENLRNGGGR